MMKIWRSIEERNSVATNERVITEETIEKLQAVCDEQLAIVLDDNKKYGYVDLGEHIPNSLPLEMVDKCIDFVERELIKKGCRYERVNDTIEFWK